MCDISTSYYLFHVCAYLSDIFMPLLVTSGCRGAIMFSGCSSMSVSVRPCVCASFLYDIIQTSGWKFAKVWLMM